MHSITCEYKTILCGFFFNRVIAIFSYQITHCQGADTNALSYTNGHVSTYILIHKGIRIIFIKHWEHNEQWGSQMGNREHTGNTLRLPGNYYIITLLASGSGPTCYPVVG